MNEELALKESARAAATLAPARLFLSGNEAIARGAWEAGVRFAAAYPGTPSTEILETLSRLPGVRSQWSVNEKVALECAVGASLGGARAITAMKHVGLNVASDPLMSLGLTGVNGGLVLVSADDPGMKSSQNEQDNRWYGSFAGIVMLEPSDPAECHRFALIAFDLSESYDLPVMLRTTTPVNHGKGAVDTGPRAEPAMRPVPRAPEKWVMLPAYGMARRRDQIERLSALERAGHALRLHELHEGDGPVGIVTSGVAFAYVREALPDAPVLKLGLTHPVPIEIVREFASRFEQILVVEELEPYLETMLATRGIAAIGKHVLPRAGELDPSMIQSAYRTVRDAVPSGPPRATVPRALPASPPVAAALPERPPELCPACPYRGPLRALRRSRSFVFGDIGCSTLGALLPHETIHFTLCMGASISAAAGYAKVRGEKAVALIGDSTLLHSGIPALLDAVYNRAALTLIVLDNCAIAMTGGQGHPGTGAALDGSAGKGLDYEALIRSLGVPPVTANDPDDGDLFAPAFAREMERPEPSVLIARRACVLVDRARPRVPAFVNPAMCTGCRECLDEGCPALVLYKNPREEDKVRIDRSLCIGCPDCSSVCAPGAISWLPEAPVARA
ncbi:MAG: indolepyruvate ferredoxin oxidoreductase subunit alpha [Acidobacteriota bacterium]